MENDEEKTVASLQEFIAWVKDFQAVIPGQEYFFRGHSKLSYELIPNVYRNNLEGKSLREYECDVYYEMLNRVPQEFDPKDVFGNLVKMQHFGIPTRLLDVTKNALVALYFAVAGPVNPAKKEAEDGRVYGFGTHFDSVSFPQELPPICSWFPDFRRSRRVNSLLGDDWWSDFMNILVREIGQFLNDNAHEITGDYLNHLSVLGEYKEKICWDIGDFEKFERDVVQQLWMLELNRYSKLGNHLSSAMERELGVPCLGESYGFHMWWDAMTRPRFVHAPMNNKRVISQQGGFILYPPHPYSLAKDYSISLLVVQRASIKVKGSSKSIIKKELEILGISEPTLFPEIDKVADFVKRKYSV